MASFNEMKTIKEKVRSILILRENSRDDDQLLISLFWYYENKVAIDDGMTALKLLAKYSSGGLTSAESIRRVRQKIQEQEPELRGEAYIPRKVEAQNVKNNIESL